MVGHPPQLVAFSVGSLIRPIIRLLVPISMICVSPSHGLSVFSNSYHLKVAGSWEEEEEEE